MAGASDLIVEIILIGLFGVVCGTILAVALVVIMTWVDGG